MEGLASVRVEERSGAMAEDRRFQVPGMHCTGCENRLKTVLGRVEGVVKAEASHQDGEVRVRYDAGRVSDEEIRERIRAAGYEVA
jgi:copper chaperone CopZ